MGRMKNVYNKIRRYFAGLFPRFKIPIHVLRGSAIAPIFVCLSLLYFPDQGRQVRNDSADIRFCNIMLPGSAVQWYIDNAGNGEHPSGEWDVATVYSGPDSNSAAVGRIWLTARWLGGGTPRLAFNLEYERSDSAVRQIWMDEERIGEWGSGINQFFPKIRSGWFRLPGDPFPREAWINIPSDSDTKLSGKVFSVVGSIPLLFDSIESKNERTMKVELLQGVFMIIKVGSDSVVCRPQVPSDMPCSEINPVGPSADSVPVYRIGAREMLEGLLHYRIRIAYPKGC
jgi:hypothetical protein